MPHRGRIKDMVIRGAKTFIRAKWRSTFTAIQIFRRQIFGCRHEVRRELCALDRRQGTVSRSMRRGSQVLSGPASLITKVPRYIRFVESFPSTVTEGAEVRHSRGDDRGICE